MLTQKPIIIAKREFLTTVKNKMFLIATFGIPLLIVIMILLSIIPSLLIVRETSNTINSFGIVDKSNIITDKFTNNAYLLAFIQKQLPETKEKNFNKLLKKFSNDVKITKYTTFDKGMKDLSRKKIQILYVIPDYYLTNGAISSYSKKSGIITSSDYILRFILRSALLEGKISDTIINRILNPVNVTHYSLDQNNRIIKEDDIKFWGSIFIPYIASCIMMLTIFIPANYLLQSVSEEKDNRIIEILLSSVTAEELLTGKILGLGFAGLLQALVWLTLILIPLSFGTVFFKLSAFSILIYLLYITYGFLFFGCIMAGIGSIGFDPRQSFQIAGLFSAISVIPMVFGPVILVNPNCLFAKILSYIPFTCPVTIMIRLATGNIDPLDIFITSAIMIPTIYFVIKLSAKVFKTGALMYGKKFTIKELIKWAKYS